MDDEAYMRMALDACRRGVAEGQSPFGACIVMDDRVVACTHNHVWMTTDPTAHAEVHAIRCACHALKRVHLEGATIYSTTEPCPMCFTAIHWARMARIVFAATVEDAKSFGFNELQISNEVMKGVSGSTMRVTPGVLREEALVVYREWKNRRESKAY